MPHRLRDIVAARAGYRCEYCLAPKAVFNSLFEAEHIQPLARGGADEVWNRALACRACNGRKHVATSAIDPTDQRPVRLFNPRIDIWSDHVGREALTAEIYGLTDIGRATVLRLHLNSPEQIRARRIWAQLPAYPEEPANPDLA